MPFYTLADLTRITGAKRRSVQLWAEAGVLQADPSTERSGTGTHRRFSRDEAIIACIVHAIARRQISIGELLSIAASLRRHLADSQHSRPLIEDAVSGNQNCYLFVKWMTTQYVCYLVQGKFISEENGEFLAYILSEDMDEPNAFGAFILLNTYVKGLR